MTAGANGEGGAGGDEGFDALGDFGGGAGDEDGGGREAGGGGPVGGFAGGKGGRFREVDDF